MKKLLFFLAFAILVSCNLKKEEKSEQKMPQDMAHQNGMGAQQQQQQQSNAAKVEGNKIYMSDFSFQIPDSWTNEQPNSSMRISQFATKAFPEIKVIGFYFGNTENMVEANIQRWQNEYTKVENTENSKAANGAIDVVLITGTFKKKPFPMADQFEEAPNYSTMACIIPSNEGPYFFKAWGPKDQIAKEFKTFVAFLNTYKK